MTCPFGRPAGEAHPRGRAGLEKTGYLQVIGGSFRRGSLLYRYFG